MYLMPAMEIQMQGLRNLAIQIICNRLRNTRIMLDSSTLTPEPLDNLLIALLKDDDNFWGNHVARMHTEYMGI